MLKYKKVKEMMIMKKFSIKALSAVLALIMVLSAFAGCGASSEPSVVSFSSTEESIVDIHTAEQESYLEKEYHKTGSANGKKEKSKPLPVRFQWDADDTNNYIFRISENSDMSDAK
ncbi:MAG: hypothetical protein K2G56_05380, partial [Eubacterium sp.]|nr:hypothetical protein [Eubacterium sp.]